MLHILTFGNPYLKDDSLAVRVADLLVRDRIQGIEVVKCISPDELLNYFDREFVILDVVQGAKDVIMIDDIDRLQSGMTVSLHDFDLGFFLKLMKETGRMESIRIIGVPQEADIEDVKVKVKKKILDILSPPPSRS